MRQKLDTQEINKIRKKLILCLIRVIKCTFVQLVARNTNPHLEQDSTTRLNTVGPSTTTARLVGKASNRNPIWKHTCLCTCSRRITNAAFVVLNMLIRPRLLLIRSCHMELQCEKKMAVIIRCCLWFYCNYCCSCHFVVISIYNS